MKRIIPHLPNITATASMLFAAVALFASAVLLSGCSESELPGNGDDNNNLAALTIKVSDGGYASTAGEKSGTRATESNYTTTFTAGDKIGVYAVKNGAIVGGVNNLCLVATDDGNGGIVWKTSDGKSPLYIPEANYYAYYPWQSDTYMTNKVTASASDANAFFATLINNWAPDTDQSTYGKYTAQDLMVVSGTRSGQTLSFSMQHQMALVVIDLPKTKYTLTNAENKKLDDYFIDAPGMNFNDFSPCRMSDGTYSYLIKPATSKSLSGSYIKTSATATWEIPANVSASQYHIYKVDGATVTTNEHILQVGDFFMSDGSLLTTEMTLTNEQKSNCIGIVYWVGDPTKPLRGRTDSNLQGDKTLAKDHLGCTHGLVVSLSEVTNKLWMPNRTSVQNWLNSNRKDEFLSVQSGNGASDPLNNIQGYNNTKAIEAFNDANSSSEAIVVQEVVEYRKKVSAPAASSDWYVPSEKELTLLCWKDVDNIGNTLSDNIGTDNRDFINRKLNLVGGTILPSEKEENAADGSTGAKLFYWSSTEFSAYGAWNMHFYNGVRLTRGKNINNCRVRFSLAF